MLCPQHRAGSLDPGPHLHPECKTSQIFPLGLISLKEGMGTGEGISSTWHLFSPRETRGRCCTTLLALSPCLQPVQVVPERKALFLICSKGLWVRPCVPVADDTLAYPRVLLLQLFITGAQEPAARFWVDKFGAGSPELCFVSLLLWVCFLPGSLCSSLGSAKRRLPPNPEHFAAKEQL